MNSQQNWADSLVDRPFRESHTRRRRDWAAALGLRTAGHRDDKEPERILNTLSPLEMWNAGGGSLQPPARFAARCLLPEAYRRSLVNYGGNFRSVSESAELLQKHAIGRPSRLHSASAARHSSINRSCVASVSGAFSGGTHSRAEPAASNKRATAR